jgi:hypothetical protein
MHKVHLRHDHGPPLRVATFPSPPLQNGSLVYLINIRAFFLDITLKINSLKSAG